MPYMGEGNVSDQFCGLKLRVLSSGPGHLGCISRLLKEAEIQQAEQEMSKKVVPQAKQKPTSLTKGIRLGVELG